MIHLIEQAGIKSGTAPDDYSADWSFETLQYVPEIGQKIRLDDVNINGYSNSGRMVTRHEPSYWEVVDVLHDLRNEEDVDIYIVIKPMNGYGD